MPVTIVTTASATIVTKATHWWWPKILTSNLPATRASNFTFFIQTLVDVREAVKNYFLGFCPLRGGGGVAPFPLSFFEHNYFLLRGGYPPIPPRKIPLKSRHFRFENSIFCLFHAFLALVGPLYGLFGPFLTLFNEKNIIFSPFRKKFPGKA